MANKKRPQPNNDKSADEPVAVEQVLVVDADSVTVDDLLKLEEAKTVREMIDALIGFTANSNDPDAAEQSIRSLSLRALLSQRAGLIEQFNNLQDEFVPN